MAYALAGHIEFDLYNKPLGKSKKGEDMKGKFGRILGDFVAPDGRLVTEIMTEGGYCVPYFGGSKEDTQAAHMINRERLISEGKVTL